MKICFRLQFGIARSQAKNKFLDKILQTPSFPAFDLFFWNGKNNTLIYVCVHIYILAGAFLQFMNTNIDSVLFPNGVQMTFLIELIRVNYNIIKVTSFISENNRNL